ncbi:MAG: capsule assembly Wzi family protein [Gammaproteobacteria bacterium]
MKIAAVQSRFAGYGRAFAATVAAGMLLANPTAAEAEPWATPGDLSLRQDIELLADTGLINLPVTSWPMSWGDIFRSVQQVELKESMSLSVTHALERVRTRARAETFNGLPQLEYGVSAAESPRRLRLFEDSPRENGQLNLAVAHTWESVSARVEFTYAFNARDNREYRFDGSYVSLVWGNTTFTLGAQERWWGPGYDGALALSTNARPVPAFAIKRNFSDPFESRWLRWLGPWTGSFFIGQMESNRGVPKPYLVGGRVAIKPLSSLELGLVRTAQWGGEGRDESFDSFFDLLIGRDNVGDGVDRANEPGNQLAGFDWRWRVFGGEQPIVFYGQLIGEDEAGGFPSRYLGQLGLSTSTPVGQNGARLDAHVEFSDTTCQFYESSKLFNCAYNNSLFPNGYRYRDRPIGHSTDNDARQVAVGASLRTRNDARYSASVRYSELNRGGSPDLGNALSPVPSDLINVELSHERDWFGGIVTVGVGIDAASGQVGGLDGNDVRGFVEWKNRY